MDEVKSSKFLSSLSEFIQFLCTKYVDFEETTNLSGQFYLSVDSGEKFQFQVNEVISLTRNKHLYSNDNSYTTVNQETGNGHSYSNASSFPTVNTDSLLGNRNSYSNDNSYTTVNTDANCHQEFCCIKTEKQCDEENKNESPFSFDEEKREMVSTLENNQFK